jgi:hypothetical protein
VAREAGASSAPLDVDTQVVPSQKEYLLLWRNSEKPKAPFNLTPYAITLVSVPANITGLINADLNLQNDIPTGLRPYLCPTDCRLRTDQRAFENAEYDRAQGCVRRSIANLHELTSDYRLKTMNEEKQRSTVSKHGRQPIGPNTS